MEHCTVKMIDQGSHYISEHAPRIHTLEIGAPSFRNRGWRMNSLKRLRVFGNATPNFLFGELEWGGFQVEYLEITPFRFWHFPKPTIHQHLAHLHHLVIADSINDTTPWLIIVDECCLTLKVLEIRLTGNGRFKDRRPLQLPSLQRLKIEVEGPYSGNCWPFDAITPLLRWYKEIQRPHPNLLDPLIFHTRTEQVVHLYKDVVPQLERYPNLRCLHLSPITYAFDSATLKATLAAARRLCKGFEALYLDDIGGHIVKSGGNFLYRVDEEGNENLKSRGDAPSRCLLNRSPSKPVVMYRQPF
ncbi:hypothetical protein M408DRAFT_25414 [Serendipita vermifera MAFF 305830]|uniref:F-box domain-containing protein n=1 Tax=Serendipita vermifera MAFF 305830 TaxID=933852 RepID=A0A0C3APE8_SERVB|nr:hypothetical protein M408DRAFT_25414 [Serendipita vermifera MAFF 305830]